MEKHYDRIRLGLDIIVLAICLWMASDPFRTGHSVHVNLATAALFLALAINCAYRIYTYFKMARIRENAATEEEIVRAERRQGLIVSIFSNAMAILVLLVFFAQALFTHFNLAFTIVLAVCALCFGGILVLSIRNLKRFDRK